MPGLHICNIALRGTDRRGEWVEIANDGSSPVALTGLEVSDYTATQQHVHIYTFPSAVGGGALALAPGQAAFVFSGHGQNARTSSGDLLLFAERSQPIWNNNGDVAYLRRPSGEFIDTMTVGDPKRHPNGH
jgi:Lamin Tail Domain